MEQGNGQGCGTISWICLKGHAPLWAQPQLNLPSTTKGMQMRSPKSPILCLSTLVIYTSWKVQTPGVLAAL